MNANQDERTMAELAKEAYDLQNACNLVGILLSAHKALIRLRQLCKDKSGYEIDRHPIMRLYADKVNDITMSYCSMGTEYNTVMSEVYTEIHKLMKGE